MKTPSVDRAANYGARTDVAVRTTLLLSVAMLIVLMPARLLAVDKEIAGSVGRDITAQDGVILWAHAGATKTCGPLTMSNKGQPVTFPLRAGDLSEASDNLCDQSQTSKWNVRGTFANGKTKFTDVAGKASGMITAVATAPKQPGISESVTTFQSPGPFMLGATRVEDAAPAAKGPAGMNASIIGGSSKAGGSEVFLLNGSPVLKVDTFLFAQNGASVSITPAGLTLLVSSGQLAGFNATEINNYDESQNLAWSVMFDGSHLVTNGINPNLFQTISGGVFLPYDAMPANDLAATVSSGSLEYDASTFADAEVGSSCNYLDLGNGLINLHVNGHGTDQLTELTPQQYCSGGSCNMAQGIASGTGQVQSDGTYTVSSSSNTPFYLTANPYGSFTITQTDAIQFDYNSLQGTLSGLLQLTSISATESNLDSTMLGSLAITGGTLAPYFPPNASVTVVIGLTFPLQDLVGNYGFSAAEFQYGVVAGDCQQTPGPPSNGVPGGS